MKATMGKAHSMRGFFARRTAQFLDTPLPDGKDEPGPCQVLA